MKLLSSRLITLDHFSITEGTQPMNAFFYIINGAFELTVDGKTRKISKNELVFFPNDMEFKRYMTSPLTFYNVQVSDGKQLPRGYVKVKNHARLLSTLEFLTELSARPDSKQRMKDHYLQDVLMQLEMEKISAEKLDDPITLKAIEFMENHLSKKISVDDIADAVGVSVTGLIQHFRKNTDVTPIRYLTLMRIKKAETLLCSKESTLSVIAAECGYDNAYYFSNVFKKEKGESPKSFRQKNGV